MFSYILNLNVDLLEAKKFTGKICSQFYEDRKLSHIKLASETKE